MKRNSMSSWSSFWSCFPEDLLSPLRFLVLKAKRTKMDEISVEMDAVSISESSSKRDRLWLPRNVLFDIADKLTPDARDLIRFGAACASWRAIFHENKNHVSSTCFPFLVFSPSPELDGKVENGAHLGAYCPASKNTYNLYSPALSSNQVHCGSSFGWLVTFETKLVGSKRNNNVQLQNPFLNQTINLPPLDKIFKLACDTFNIVHQLYHNNLTLVPTNSLHRMLRDIKEKDESDSGRQGTFMPRPHDFLHKAALSSDPASSTDFIVVGIVDMFCSLAFFRSGDETWTPIGDSSWTLEGKLFSDVIYFHKTRQFYAALQNGQVLAIDFAGEPLEPKLTPVAPENGWFKDVFLVEDLSSGDLYQVNNEIGNCMVPRCRKPICKFNIFKFNAAEKKWECARTLGNNVLFFGYNGLMLCPASSCAGCEPNCIYFITYMDNHMESKYYEPPFAGIYNLEDGSVRALSTQTLPSSIWLQPTLC